jgi:hypothetical protein
MGSSYSSLSDEHDGGVFLIRNAQSGTYLELSLTRQPEDLRDELTGRYSAGIRLPDGSEGAACFNSEGQFDCDERPIV